MDQASAGASVAIAEGMDRLELGVGDRGLRYGWQVVKVAESNEIVEERTDTVFRRRHEGRVARA